MDFKKNKGKDSFKKGWLFGFIFQGFFHLSMFRLSHFAPLISVFLVWFFYSLYLGFFYGLLFWLFNKLRNLAYYEWTFPFLWIIFEWLRSLGPIGNPGGSLGYSQSGNLPLIQLASVFGVFGISFYIVLINVLIYWLLIKKTKKQIIIVLLLVIIIPFIWGSFRFSSFNNQINNETLKIAVIQGNHTEDEKKEMKNIFAIRDDYFRLTSIALEAKPTLIFWPETITSTLNLAYPDFIAKTKDFCFSNKVNIIFGTPILKNNYFYNSVVLATAQGISEDKYYKNQLMPFGEYTPFRGIWESFFKLNFLGADYTGYNSKDLIKMGEIKLGGGVCLESIYPWHYRELTKKGANLLFVLANDAWFFDSSAAFLHLQMSIFRAVENNRYFVQSANTGISAIITNTGKIIKKSNIEQTEILSDSIKIIPQKTLYYYLGDSLVYFAIILISLIFLIRSLIKPQKIESVVHNRIGRK